MKKGPNNPPDPAILEILQRLEEQVQDLGERLGRLEAAAPSRRHWTDPDPDLPDEAPAEDEAEIKQVRSTKHQSSVTKALRLLGLVPSDEAAAPKAPARSAPKAQNRASHAAALEAARRMRGDPSPATPDPDPPRIEEAAPAEQPSPEAVATAVLEDPEPGPQIVVASRPRPKSDTAIERPAHERVDMKDALTLELGNGRTGPDRAVPILNAFVLVAAGAAAVYGAMSASWVEMLGRFADEMLAGVLAGVLSAAALIWRTRWPLAAGLCAAAATLAAHVALANATREAGPLPGWADGSLWILLGLAAGWLVGRAGHPLGLYLGPCVALVLPLLGGADVEVQAAATFAGGLAAALAALRLRCEGAGLPIALGTVLVLLTGDGAWSESLATPILGGSVALLLLGLAVGRPLLLRKPPIGGAPTLVLAAVLLTGGVVHGISRAPTTPRIVVQLAVGFAAGALALAVRGRRHEVLRGFLKAAAGLLVLSALPAGLDGHARILASLVGALAFGLLALRMRDASLRALGGLLLIAALVDLGGQLPNVQPAAAIAMAAAILAAVRVGEDPLRLTLLFASLGHAALLYSIWRGLGLEIAVYVWAPLAVGMGWAGRVYGLPNVRVGAGWAATAAAVGSILMAGRFGVFVPGVVAVAAFAGLVRVESPLNVRREASLYLHLTLVLAAGLSALGLPGPQGALGLLPILALLHAPFWGEARQAMTPHVRLLTALLCGRVLLLDLPSVAHAGPVAWWSLAAACAAAAAAVLRVRDRGAAGALFTCLFLAVVVLGADVALRLFAPAGFASELPAVWLWRGILACGLAVALMLCVRIVRTPAWRIAAGLLFVCGSVAWPAGPTGLGLGAGAALSGAACLGFLWACWRVGRKQDDTNVDA